MNKPYSFWRTLFCDHKWSQIQNLSLYDGVAAQASHLPTNTWRRWECDTCGKITKQKIL